MRDIRFRAFDKKEKIMYYTDDGRGFIFCISPVGGYWVMDSKNENIDQNFTEWMQFTGIKDKHAKEIYESDIVKRTYFGVDSDLSLVVFRKGAFMLKHPKEEAFASMPIGDFEVVGNIWENPDLLGVK